MKPSISTHILDTERGEPLTGLRVELYHRDVLLSTPRMSTWGGIGRHEREP
jgi:5-hydroxyisourate hydrolase-like protein (transthyretin family)